MNAARMLTQVFMHLTLVVKLECKHPCCHRNKGLALDVYQASVYTGGGVYLGTVSSSYMGLTLWADGSHTY